MIKNFKPRNVSIHLYNPKEEGLGQYDANYINAYRKNKNFKIKVKQKETERYAA